MSDEELYAGEFESAITGRTVDVRLEREVWEASGTARLLLWAAGVQLFPSAPDTVEGARNVMRDIDSIIRLMTKAWEELDHRASRMIGQRASGD